MTLHELKEMLKNEGVWRCKIVENVPSYGVTLYVPKTSRHRLLELRAKYMPVGLLVSVEIMKKPLKYKKYTYLVSNSYHN